MISQFRCFCFRTIRRHLRSDCAGSADSRAHNPKTIKSLPGRPRSADRTRSPAAVSRKREYFKYRPETIGYFAPKWPNSAPGDGPLNRKSPPLAGISGVTKGKISAHRGREDSNLRMVESKSGYSAND